MEYCNSEDIIDEIFNKIDSIINSTNLVFSHLIIDGIDVYDNYYNYFLDNIKNIEEVRGVTKTIKEISQDIILSTIDYIDRAVPEIEILSR